MRIIIILFVVLSSGNFLSAQNKRNNPTNAYNAGVEFLQRKQYSEAIFKFTLAIQLDSTDRDAFFNRAVAFYKISDFSNACKDWRQGYFHNDSAAMKMINKYCDSIAINEVDTFWMKDGMYEVMPEFPGGYKEFEKYLADNIKYPTFAIANGISGRVVVTFVITKSGKVSEITILRSVDNELNEEAVRVISSMPTWKPGLQGGKTTRVKYTVPIIFSLPR